MSRTTLRLIVLVALFSGCSSQPDEPSTESFPVRTSDREPTSGVAHELTEGVPLYAGSESCRDCHAEFHELWETSWHVLAMQPYSAELAMEHLQPLEEPIVIDQREYTVELNAERGWMHETSPDGEQSFEILHAMGGKNIYYFLTPMERGRLQVMPLAYDVNDQAWYDVAASGVRHFPDQEDEALDWTDRLFTFNTTCFNCHVSQLATNYDLSTDTYRTTWAEPGISCESCHGPAHEHVRVFEEAAARGEEPEDMAIIRTSQFTPQQMNDLCATCHAKMSPISIDFLPGDPFYDHYDLITLEHPDYYPDGRDLGENYSMTSWLMSACVVQGDFDCNHCHTSSGRMRFSGPEINHSCLPCHQERVDNPAPHHHHPPGTEGISCNACHMPMTRFAGMNRSDHSMRPPMPAATLEFGSANACNMCHTDEDAAWADEWVRQWHGDARQDAELERARLIDQARRRQWDRLPEMLAHIRDRKHDEVHRNSLVRLLQDCPDPVKWPVIRDALQDPSPLVRSSAAAALGDSPMTREILDDLLEATRDPYRLVRIRAAMALAPVPPHMITRAGDRESLERAVEEFTTSMSARPDDWSSHANLGNFFMQRRDYEEAVEHYETSYRLEPRSVGPMVNAAIAYSNLNRRGAAERSLRRALEHEPDNAAAHFNLGLLLAERGQAAEAEQALRKAFQEDPQMAQAAYNLGVLLAEHDLAEAVTWCRKAYELRPEESRYAHSLAYYLHRTDEAQAAIEVLRAAIDREPTYWDAYLLLGEIYEQSGRPEVAADLYRQLIRQPALPARIRQHLTRKTAAGGS